MYRKKKRAGFAGEDPLIKELLLEAEAQKTTEILLHDLESGNWLAKWRAADLLGKRKVRSATPLLIRILYERDECFEVRTAAAGALGKFKGPPAIMALAGILLDSSQWSEVRSSAAENLGRMKSPFALHAISSAISDEDEKVRKASIKKNDESLCSFSGLLARELYPQWNAYLGRLCKARREKEGRMHGVPQRIPKPLRRNWRRELASGKGRVHRVMW